MTKRAVLAIVQAMPADETLPDSEPLVQDAVRWAIEAYYGQRDVRRCLTRAHRAKRTLDAAGTRL